MCLLKMQGGIYRVVIGSWHPYAMKKTLADHSVGNPLHRMALIGGAFERNFVFIACHSETQSS